MSFLIVKNPKGLRVLWSLPNKAAAEAQLRDWIAKAKASGIKILKDMAKTLRMQKRGTLAYFDHRISTVPREGINNKIKTL